MRLKLYFSTFLGLVFSFAAIAQDKHCYTTEVYNEVVKQHPEVLKTQDELEQFTQQFIAGEAQKRTTGQTYIIPLVFHIIHNYGPEDISDAQVLDEVRILNLDYRKLNADTGAVIPAFKSIAADCGIEFRLANIDPNGKCTNGIDRIVSTLTYNADDNSKLNPWPANQYLNIWVVNSLASVGAAAYAYLPGTVPYPEADGVIVLHNYVGSIGTSNPITSRTVTHEIGHCLNLYHPWGRTNTPGVACGDDNVDDTPVTEGWQTCNINGASCGNVVDNVQNYMEYSYCTNMFTQGQKSRMLAALNSTTSGRNNLWSAANATATGINNSVPNTCAPIADFLVSPLYACTGKNVQFTDMSWNGQPNSWNWSFPGGNPGTSTDSMPVVYYAAPGTYNATLIAGNSNGINSVTKTSVLRVNSSSGSSIPYSQNFEATSSFPGNDGYIINPDDGITWVRSTNAGSSGTSSIMIHNYTGNPSGEIDSYVTQAFDLTYVTLPTLTFKVANAQRSANSADKLKVYVSIDCGSSWIAKYTKAGATLATAGIITSNFVPTSSQWRLETVSLSLFAGNPNVRIKFENTSDAGNNTYIDDINITGVVGLNEENVSTLNFDIYPNPSNGEFTVSFDLQKESNTQLRIFDIMGRQVSQLSETGLNAGLHNFNLNTDSQTHGIAKGIYFVELVVDGNRTVKKLIVN